MATKQLVINGKSSAEELDLSNQNLKKIPPQLAMFKKLKKLSLKDNNLKNLENLLVKFRPVGFGPESRKEVPDWVIL